MFRTINVNLLGGAGCGKTVLMADVFSALKKAGQTAEMVQELVKDLVWEGRLHELKNQAGIAEAQYRVFKSRQTKTRFVVTDGPLAHALYYNRHYPHDSNIEETESQALAWLSEFEAVNLFLTRGDFKYEQEGRYQTEAESKAMDEPLWTALAPHIPLRRLPPFPSPERIAKELIRLAGSANLEAASLTEAFRWD